MLKDATFKEKFTLLKSWIPSIVESIKKDLKNDHLKNDWQFTKKYFGSKNPSKLTSEELAEGYLLALEGEAGEQVGEFITNRWLLKHPELYGFFEEELSKINPNFNELTEIDRDRSFAIIEKAIDKHGAPHTYFFAVLNSVVFPKEAFDRLNKSAKETLDRETSIAKKKEEIASIENLQQSHDEQISRLTDKYEKKLQGLQKKYLVDVETLKKQIANLQKKLDNK